MQHPETALTAAFSGRIRAGTDAAERARGALWNAAASISPLALVECRDEADVRRAVSIAGEHGLPVSVLSGGHDWAGRAVCSGGVTLDVRNLASISLSRDRTSVVVGGGTTTGGLVSRLPNDVAAVTGVWSSTGVVGVAMGGGYGKLNRMFGLAADNIVRAEVVLADGSTTVAGEDDDAELLWALRGGGGNFGVVTSMTLATHRVPDVLSGLFFVPLAQAKVALIAVEQVLEADDDGLSVQPILATLPGVGVGLFLAPLWIGERTEGERRLRSIANLDGARTLFQGWSPYRNIIDEANEANWPKQGDYRMDAYNVPRIDETIADALIEAARTFTSDQDALILHDFFGAATRVPTSASAFAMREPHLNIQVVAARHPSQDLEGRRRAAWLHGIHRAFAPWRSRGGYPNVLGPEPEARSRARSFYGEGMGRLLDAKRRYDPTDMFRSNVGHA